MYSNIFRRLKTYTVSLIEQITRALKHFHNENPLQIAYAFLRRYRNDFVYGMLQFIAALELRHSNRKWQLIDDSPASVSSWTSFNRSGFVTLYITSTPLT